MILQVVPIRFFQLPMACNLHPLLQAPDHSKNLDGFRPKKCRMFLEKVGKDTHTHILLPYKSKIFQELSDFNSCIWKTTCCSFPSTLLIKPAIQMPKKMEHYIVFHFQVLIFKERNAISAATCLGRCSLPFALPVRRTLDVATWPQLKVQS